MRIGSVLVFLVASWIALGYLLSNNINVQQSLNRTREQLNRALVANKEMQDRLDKANSENTSLSQQLVQKDQEIRSLRDQVKDYQGEIRGLKEQNANIQRQLDVSEKINVIVGGLRKVSSQSVMFAIFLPILPVSLALSYAIYRNGHNRYSLKSTEKDKSKRVVSIQVTEAELRAIIALRRR